MILAVAGVAESPEQVFYPLANNEVEQWWAITYRKVKYCYCNPSLRLPKTRSKTGFAYLVHVSPSEIPPGRALSPKVFLKPADSR